MEKDPDWSDELDQLVDEIVNLCKEYLPENAAKLIEIESSKRKEHIKKKVRRKLRRVSAANRKTYRRKLENARKEND